MTKDEIKKRLLKSISEAIDKGIRGTIPPVNGVMLRLAGLTEINEPLRRALDRVANARKKGRANGRTIRALRCISNRLAPENSSLRQVLVEVLHDEGIRPASRKVSQLLAQVRKVRRERPEEVRAA